MLKSVLIADDDPEVRSVIAEYLEARQCHVRQVENGIDALRELGTAPPDVLIIDLMMPRLGGLAALRIVAPSYPATRLIVITGMEDPALFSAARAAGAHDILVKPIDLPLLGQLVHMAAASSTSAPAARPADTAGARPAAGRLLVVDDDVDVAAMVADKLAADGYATRSVHSAAEAFWAILQEMPDAILLDVTMPGLSGVEIIPALRFASRDVKIIMVSGTSDMTLAKQALAYGAFDFITKPIDFDLLRETLRQALGTAAE
ncbi:MAG TPA: response regulator [Candidatus Limnocylindria bacterium]|nr:response regulator [Candidatus Limnocylindria bacterium]